MNKGLTITNEEIHDQYWPYVSVGGVEVQFAENVAPLKLWGWKRVRMIFDFCNPDAGALWHFGHWRRISASTGQYVACGECGGKRDVYISTRRGVVALLIVN